MLDQAEPTLHGSGNMGPDLGAREAALPWLTSLGGAALMLTCVGCHHVVPLGHPSSEGEGSTPAVVGAKIADSAALEHLHRHLERRLATLEARLAAAQGSAAAEELRAERLLLNVALVLIHQDIAAARRGAGGDAPTVDQLLGRASRRISQARDRLDRGEVTADGRGPAGDRDQRSAFALAGRGDRDARPRRRHDSGHKCSPNDPLCGGLDEGDDPLAGFSDGQGGGWLVDTPESTPKPPTEAKPEPRPEPVVPDPGSMPDRNAAQVAHARAPQGVTQTVSRRHGQLAACLPPALRSKGVRLNVRARLDKQGAFREPQVLATDVEPQVAACIEDVFRQMQVVGYDQGSRHITVPLWFGGNR